MNNLESAEKKRKRLIALIALIVALNVLLVLVFATNVGEQTVSEVTVEETVEDTNNETEEIIGNKEIATIVTGSNFTVALDSAGKVWSWGQNSRGQLGNGTLADSNAKTAVILNPETQNNEIVQLSNVKQIAAGEYHAAALTNDGKVYMWGYNYFGQVGSTTKRVEVYPQLIEIPNGVSVEEIACGADYTLMLTSAGRILGIGDSSDGQLGYYNDLSFTSIREIDELKSEADAKLPNMKEVVAGYNHILAIDNAGQVWTWGDTTGSGFEFTAIKPVTFADLADGETIKELEAGNGVSMALTTAGNIYTWEMGGTPTKVDLAEAYTWDYTATTPTQIALDGGVQVRADGTDNIAVINKTFYLIDTNNNVYSWGANNVGQCGIGTTSTTAVAAPTRLRINPNVEINEEIDKVTSSAVTGISTAGATDSDTAYAINADGYVLGWGYAGTDIVDTTYTEGSNTFKLLGDGTRSVADYIGSVSVKSIVSDDIVLDITEQGIANKKNSMDLMAMLEEQGYVTGGRVNLYKNVATSNLSSLEVKTVDQSIATFDNETGIITGVQEGRTIVEVKSSKNTIYINVEVIGDNFTFAKIESGSNFTVALKADGTVWAWGYNSYLGIIDTNHNNHSGIIVPTQVKGLTNIKDISVGENFVLVIKEDGTVWSWGYNKYGQLGNGTSAATPGGANNTITKYAPQLVQVLRYQIDTITKEVKIAMPTPVAKTNDAGENVTDDNGNVIYVYTEDGVTKECTTTDNGDTYTDGQGNIVIKKDTDGKLYKYENGAFKTNTVEEDVLGNHALENIVSVSAGNNYVLALDKDGTVWSWGYNNYGQLGLGNKENQSRARVVNTSKVVDKEGNKEPIKQIEAGKYTSYILTNSGDVYAFGYNGNRQCGISGTYYVPTKITTISRITKVSTNINSNGSAFALTVNGKVWAFGYGYNAPTVLGLENVVDIERVYGNYGQIVKLADGTVGYWTTKTAKSVTNDTLARLKNTDGTENFTDVMAISGGSGFYTVAKNDGTVWSTGANGSGQLGNRTLAGMGLPRLKNISKEYIALNANEITLKVDATETIKATHSYGFNLLYSEVEEVEITTTSLDEEIATVEGNVIKAVKPGITYVVAETEDGTKLRVKVNVLAEVETTIPDMAVGYRHTVSVKTDGTVWGWGYNSYGELGVVTGKITEPQQIYSEVKIKDVAAGSYHTLMLTTDGKVLAMGYNKYGQLGNNTTSNSKVPVTVKTQGVDDEGNVVYKDLEGIVKVVAYNYTSLALDKDGNLYVWGQNASRYATKVDTYGLKVRDISERLILTEDGRVFEYLNKTTLVHKDTLNNIVEVSSSSYLDDKRYGFYMALDAEGRVFTWVKNTGYSNNLVSGTETTVPTLVTFEEGIRIVEIEAGRRVAYAKDENRNVYSWGKSVYAGTLGLGATNSVTVPTKIVTLKDAELMAASKYYSSYARAFVADTAGSVYGFGTNGSYSLLGNLDTSSYYNVPTLVGESFAGFVVDGKEVTRLSMEKGTTVDIEAGLMDAFNLRSLTSKTNNDETDFEWQVFNADLVSIANTTGTQNTITASDILGEATLVAIDKKTEKVAKLFIDVVEKDTKVAPKVDSTNNHTIALKADGTVWAWGNNAYYQLGIRNQSVVAEPKQVRIAKQIAVAAPVLKVNDDGSTAVNANGKEIYVDAQGNEYLQVGDNYTDLSGVLKIKQDIDDRLYAWDANENTFALEDILDENGNPIVIVDIATSKTHTLVLTTDGDVYSFGRNNYGQLGYTTINNYGYIPTKVGALKNIVKIVAGENYSLALDKYGRLWGFGYLHIHNKCTDILDNTAPKRLTKIRNADITTFMKNAIDITNEYVLTKDGEVYSLKLNNGSLTEGTQVEISKEEGITEKVIKITRTSGNIEKSGHTAFLTENGEVFTIGYGTKGQLGNGGEANSKQQAVQVMYKTGDNLTNVRDVYVGENHTVAITKEGKMVAWGDNTYGQLRSELGSTAKTPRAYDVVEDSRIANAIAVSAGNGFTVAVDASGYAYAWGQGTSAQLGNKLAVNSKEIVRVGTEGISLNKNHVTLQENGADIEISGRTNLLNLIYAQNITINSVKSNDSNVATSTKVNSDTIKLSPANQGVTSVIVETVSELGNTFENIIQVTVLPGIAELADDIVIPAGKIIEPMTVSGDSHTLILKSDGTVWAYGDNTYGQTAAQGVTYSDKVTKVEFPKGTPSIISVAAGNGFSIALDVDGNVYAWGYNRYGQLGQGTYNSKVNAVPTKISGLSGIVKVVAGANQVMALDSNGYAYSWGRNVSGSLGIGSTSDSYSPIRINNVSNVIDIAAGTEHAMLLTSAGEVYTTGRNSVGQLGNSNEVNRVLFAKVEISEKVAYIEAGDRANLVIDVKGTVWAWGNNENGQLGLGSQDKIVYVPTKVTSVSNVERASVGENHTHIVTTNGKLYVAGSNNYGQLGIGEGTETTNTFVQVTKLGANVMNSDAGNTYSTAIDYHGTVFGFGDYNHGNIDRVSLTDSYEPIMISDNTSYLDEKEVVINVGESYTLNTNGRYKLNVLHKDNSRFTFESVSNNIATVDENGAITGVEIGTTMVKATDETGKVNSVIVKVIPKDAKQAPSIEGGDKFANVTNQNGTVYLFGNKENVATTSIPKIINDSLSFVSTKAGKDFVVAINNDGTVWAWGDNTYGQLGNSELASSEQIVRINRNYIKDVAQIDAGEKHVIALDNLGTVYVWGDNSNGQLGVAMSDETALISVPTVIRPVTGRIISVSAGGNYSAIVNTHGEVYILRGGIAHKISGITGAVKVATGSEETLVLTNEGRVYVVDNDLSTPTLKSIDGEIVDIAVSDNEFMCLASDKTLYVFGDNTNGQLGNGSTNTVDAAEKVAENVYTMGAGNNNTYYINTQGTVYAAGLNTSGELGNGTRGNADTVTAESSSRYVKVGDSAFGLDPEKVKVSTNWNILVSSSELTTNDDKTKVVVIEENNEFNVFENNATNLGEYDFEITDTSKAEITEPETLKVVTKELGTTTLKATNKVTKEEAELTIFIVSEELLRIEDMYVTDTVAQFDSEIDEENKYLINTEGSEDVGTLNVELSFNDTLKVFDGETELTATNIAGTNNWQVTGMDLSKSVQELTLQLTTADGEKTYEFTLIIYKEAVIKVNDEILSAVEQVSKETAELEKVYTKYINPADEKANAEIYINNTENKIQLEDTEGNVLKTAEPNSVLETELDVPNVQNRFFIRTINPQNETDKVYVLEVLKSSIEEITIIDTEEDPINVIADRIDGTDYVEEFSAKINDVNNPLVTTIKLGNKNIKKVTVNGEVVSINDSKVEISKALNEDETQTTDFAIEITAIDPITNVEYTEKHMLKVTSISSNNNIKEIILKEPDAGIKFEPGISSRPAPDEDFAYEIVIHDPKVSIGNVTLTTVLESEKAKFSYNNGKVYQDSNDDSIISVKDNRGDGNKYETKFIVRAENGDIQEYNLYIYKQSENAKIDTINVTSLPEVKTKVAIKENGTNNYIGKVLKTSDNYQIAIDLVDSYSVIESITVDGVDSEELATLLTQESGADGKYVYAAAKDILGKTITIVVKPEYPEAPAETFTLTIQEMDDNANFEYIAVDTTTFGNMELDTFTHSVKGLEKGELEVKAESDTAKVEVYLTNPTTDSNAVAIGVGTGSLTMDIPFEGEKTKTLYIKVTSEDEVNSVVKTLTVTKLSNNANIKDITLGDVTITGEPDENNNYIISIPDSMVNPVIIVTPEDEDAQVLIDGEDLNNTNIDIADRDSIDITVISSDGTVTEDYTLNINRSSTNLNFTKEIQSLDGLVIKTDSDFELSGNQYTVHVAENLGDIVLNIAPDDPKTTVQMVITKVGTTDVPEEERVDAGNKIQLDSATRTEVELKLTSEYGTEITWTIVVSSKNQILKSASVSGEKSEVITLTEEQITNLQANARIHPDSNKATVTLETEYDVTINASIMNTTNVSDDEIIEPITVTAVTNNKKATFTVDLLDNINDVAEVVVQMTTEDGEVEILELSITRGSTEPTLEKVVFKGTTSQEAFVGEYGNRYTQNVIINSTDSVFDMDVVCVGTYKMYKLAESANWNTVDLTTQEDVSDITELEVTEDTQEFVIEVTSEYGGNTEKYYLSVRKTSTNTQIDNLTISTDDGKEKKHITDFAEFEKDESTGMMTTTVVVPQTVNKVSLYELVLVDENAKAEWTDITDTISKDYSEYVAGAKKELTNISVIDLSQLGVICIKVTSESGVDQEYCINIRKANDNIELGEFNVYNVTEDKEEAIENNEAKIVETVEQIKVTGKATGAIKLKVTQVNGHAINENVSTSPEFRLDSNSLDMFFDVDYKYTDENEEEQTILSSAVKTITIERTVQAEGYNFYPSYYEGANAADYTQVDTLTITRLMKDASVIITYEDNGEKTITSDDFEEAKLEDGKVVREKTVYVSSALQELIINNIKSNNEYAKVTHNETTKVGVDGIYNVSNPYKVLFNAGDKAEITETIIVEPEVESENVEYRVTFVKYSKNDDVGSVTLNGFETARESNTDVFNDVLLSTKKVNVGVTKVEENAEVKVYISGVSTIDKNLTVTNTEEDKLVVYGDALGGKRNITKDLSNKLIEIANDNYVSRNNITQITVTIEVKPQDPSLNTRVYTLNIDIIDANLISINGLDINGNVDENAQILVEDFTKGRNPFYTEEIVIPAGIDVVELTDIYCQGDDSADKAKVYDAYGNELTDRKLLVDLVNGEATAIIKVDARGVMQQYNIVIRNALTDTSIKQVTVKENTTHTPNEEDAYVVDIRANEDPEVQVVLNDVNAKVISAMVDGTSYNVANNKFTVTGVALSHDDTAQVEPIIVKVKVQAENATTEPEEHTIKLVRKHVETGLEKVVYDYEGSQEITLDYSQTEQHPVQTIPSNVEGIRIKLADVVCANAKAYVKLADGTLEEIDATKLYPIESEKTEVFTIVVVAEFGNQKEYTFRVKRLSANTNLTDLTLNVNGETIIAEYDETKGMYTADIRVTEDPVVVIKPESQYAKIVGIPTLYKQTAGDLTSASVQEVNDTNFGIIGLSGLYTDDDTEDASADANRFINVEFDVAAEDTNVVKTYKLEITRRHIDTSIPNISYEYEETVTAEDDTTSVETKNGTLTLVDSNVQEILVETTVEKVSINKIIPNCDKANLTITVDGIEVTQTDNGFIVDLPEAVAGDGCVRTVVVTVTADSGDTTQYKFEVIRMATNASLGKVYVKDVEAVREDSTDDTYEAIFRANVLDTDVTATIKAISANKYAKVSINSVANESNVATVNYDLSTAIANNAREVELEIVVTPQADTVADAKTYKLIMTRLHTSPVLEEIAIKPATEGATADPIVLKDNANSTEHFTQKTYKYEWCTNHERWEEWYWSKVYSYQTERIYIPTEWTEIAIGDILPEGVTATNGTISRISKADPYMSSVIKTYNIDETFIMPEGEDVFIKVVTTSESGNTRIYVINLYKKGTSNNLLSINVNGTKAELDSTDNIYKVNVSSDDDTIGIALNAENNLSKNKTNITSIIINGNDVTELLAFTKTGSGRQITFTLNDVLTSLDVFTDKVLTIQMTVQPEDETVDAATYTLQITRIHTSAEIKQITGNDEDVAIDKQITHYKSIGKTQIDNTIYTQYIDDDVTEVTTDIIAKSAYAEIYVNDDYKGLGNVEDYKVQIQGSLTKVYIKLVSEDKLTTKNYQLWFIKKSDDATIKELWVDGNELSPNNDGNYEYTISDTAKDINVKMIPNYELANVSINGQAFTWTQAEELIENINTYAMIDGKVRIELRIQIPAEQSESGKLISKVQYLFVERVSTENGIQSITTDNDSDEITPGNSPQNGLHNGIESYKDTYKVLLEATAETRDMIDLRIEPVSPMAKMELYDLQGNMLAQSNGTLYYEDLAVTNTDITVVKVKVIPQMGRAKEYFIDVTPKACSAELIEIKVGEQNVTLVPGQYEYKVSNFGLSGIGSVYAKAEYNKDNNQYGISTVNIYSIDNPNGTGEQDGEATLDGVDFDNTTYVSITVEAPNGVNTNTYTLWLKDVSDDRTLEEVSYKDGEETVIVTSTPSEDKEYAGEYVIELQPEKQDIDITIKATDPLSYVQVEELTGTQILNVSKDLSKMTEDIVLDIIVTAESGNKTKYKLIIKKDTIITGKIETENINRDYSGVNVKVLDSQEQEIANGLTQEDGTYSIELTAGDNYKVVIEKDGYLTHTVINIPATYGVRRYVGFAELIAGEVATEDEYIELRDLVQVRRKVRANTAVDSSTEKYDFNEDGIIDSKDLDIVTKNYDKKAKVVEYTKAVNIIGEVLDADSIYVQNATVEMEAIAITNETGEFNLGDIGLGDYTLIVKDSKGNVIGSEEITIAEGTEYTIQNNVITITPNTGIVDITVRVNGTIAIISKRGEESDADIVNPENVTLNAEIVDNGIKLTATAEDSNLSKFTFYSVAEDGTRTEIAAEAITGVTTATVEKVYVKATQFNEIYKFEVDVKDMFGNAATANAQITDNTIKTVDDLVEFSKLVNSSDSTIRNNYEGQTLTLAEDLDLADLGDGKTFNPIGSRGKTFKGTFDGKGHTISNININAKGFTGLFGYTEGAIIKNIGIESGNITSTTGNNVGGIVGFAKGTLIENCYNKANVTAIGSNVGGIVGSAQGTTILTNCYSTGTISGASSIGGIAGTITERETIQNCYSIGTITGTDSVGEIVGTISVDQTIKTEEEYGMFENCYYLVTNTNPGIGETMSEQTYVAEPITDITTLLSELGDAFKADFETPINNGYPILAWEEDPLTLMSLRESEVTLPISGEYTITSEFGTRIDPITGEEGDKHYGMDIASNYQDPILAIANGTVTFAGENGGYGYCVEIEHVINGETVYSFYAHLNRIDVEVGDTVVKGEQIGLEGGRPGDPGAGTSTGVHLHLEIRKISGSYSSAVDPRNYLEF